ncbi:hypothetical protein P9869_11095 [Streptomyces ossamyceticus]|nr:hypothetical protein [Streptomyces ossamyceticus]
MSAPPCIPVPGRVPEPACGSFAVPQPSCARGSSVVPGGGTASCGSVVGRWESGPEVGPDSDAACW